MKNTTGSGWKFEVREINDNPAADFDPNEVLNFDLIDEANEEINKAQKEEAKDWWKK